MRHRLALSAFLILTTPALAQTAPAPASPPEPTGPCVDLVKSLGLVRGAEETRFEDLPDGCRITNLFADFGPYARYRIGEVVLRGPDLFADGKAPDLSGETIDLPSEIDLKVSGFQFAPDTGSALNDYIIEMQSDPLDIHLNYRWDRESGDFDLGDFSVRTSDGSGIVFAARASGIHIDRAHIDKLQTLPGAIEDATLTIDNARFLAAMVNPALLSALPPDEDPRPLIANYQKAAIAMVNSLRAETISADSKAVVVDFIEAFPRPQGDYVINLRADPPLAFGKLAIDNMADALALLPALQLSVSHAP